MLLQKTCIGADPGLYRPLKLSGTTDVIQDEILDCPTQFTYAFRAPHTDSQDSLNAV